MSEIKKLSKIYKFFVIEDACHALSGKFKNSMVGSCKYSDITTFSFHAIKNVTAGEGGAAMTNNSDISKKLNLLRTHGITREKKFFSKKTLKSYQPIMNKFYLDTISDLPIFRLL